MSPEDFSLSSRLDGLLALPQETEWVEFKHNNANPDSIGERLSALANSAILHDQSRAWMVWGIEDGTHQVLGTTFLPRKQKVGNQELEGWLSTQLHPRVDFRIHEWEYAPGKPVVLFEIFPCWHTPVRFREKEFIRVGSTTRPLRDYPEKERQLWDRFQRSPVEKGICMENLPDQRVVDLLDVQGFFDLLGLPSASGVHAVLERLEQEGCVLKRPDGRWDITNLGGLLCAKDLRQFPTLSRKCPRVIVYKGKNRVETLREPEFHRGYATGFEDLTRIIHDQLPANEVLGLALRREVRMYPEVAVRELVANALIHQDFAITGDGPKVEIFTDRVEITNPGRPLIDTLRFVDEPPRSRNEAMAALMRRMKICEERGSGIDKVLFHIEVHQLPAPEFRETGSHTITTLFSTRDLDRMEKPDRVRATYLHACLKHVSNEQMTNESLRKRLNIPDPDYPKASRIIRETIESKLIKPRDMESKSRKHAKYLPFWA